MKPRAFVERGCAFVLINYPLPPAVSIKQMAVDVAKAIRWVHGHARGYGGDPNTIFVMGHSAGAQLAALVCTDDRYLKAEGLSLNLIKGCVPVDGDTYDVVARIATGTNHALKFGDVDSQKDLSAVTHIVRGKGIPPFLILHIPSTPPRSGTHLQAEILAHALKEAGIPVRVFQG